MDSKELRIGNLVCWADEVEDIPVVITGVFGEDDIWVEMTFDNGEKDGTDTNLKSVRPIQLSEEWLLCGGLKKEIGYIDPSVVRFKFHNGLLDLTDGKLSWAVNSAESLGDNYVELCEMEYVHQFQNFAYSLTGKELEFTL
jgi:hypothetical protein